MTDRLAAADLPVRSALPALRAALDSRGAAVLCAPPGTGKTTLVPLVLAGLDGRGPVRKVVVAEPRRMAARAAARRMAWLLGEEVGGRVGFTVRGERRAGPRTVVEVVTTGVLLQRLQRDQELSGTDVVILDECHERHLDADTTAAFLLDVRAALRPELRLVAASATTDAAGWARLLDADVVEAEGVSHPVEVVWAPPPRPVRPPHGMRVDPALLDHVAATVRRALAEREGDVLCFLPGVGEIARVAGMLGGAGRTDAPGIEVLQVHGRAPAATQDAVLAGRGPGDRRRVVLATSVAESSLTVPGVRIVVDGGLAREPRTDHARGLAALATVRASQASARQRAGRAGREAPGAAYRCWPEAEQARLPRYPAPEIAVADLTAFALQAACWGDPEASDLALLDPPPPGAMAAARDTLHALGALDAAGRATPRGAALGRLGVHPRLARALLDGTAEVGARAAAEAVALLSEEPPREYGDDLAAALRRAQRGQDGYAARWRTEARRLERAVRQGRDESRQPAGRPPQEAPALIAALAFPERIAKARNSDTYLMTSGTGAQLDPASPLRNSPWLTIAVADRPVGRADARVRLAAHIDEDTARRAAAPLLVEEDDIRWDSGRRAAIARRITRLGAIELDSTPLRKPDPGALRTARLDALTRDGLASVLHWPAPAAALRERLAFLHHHLGDPWPDVSDAALVQSAADWLPDNPATRPDPKALLTALLPWSTGEAARLDELAPERVEVPTGSRIRIDYADPAQPVLAVKLQELFGLTDTPRIADGRVPLLVHLLSPAGRPAAVTADLKSFWAEGYRSVRAELRGRYPKHPWPEDPATAEPTRRTKAAQDRDLRR
ncbi:ATP-dependent helicase HrpB [Streptomyces boninensis]|uniref:ATP-dependent helicase HrpB n=1 Tax=Streptomyces boninensis TaxID=2039455 RepID=UPI003B216DCC